MTVADDLHEYMRFRAGEEGVKYDLSPEVFQDLIDNGVYTFFGIEIDNDNILSDTQNPVAFAEWQAAGN